MRALPRVVVAVLAALAALAAVTLGACTLSTTAGFTSAGPTGNGAGGGVRATAWTDVSDLARPYALRPIFGSELALDAGDFGWRLHSAGLIGAAYGGDPVLVYGFVGLAPVALGHLAKDRDPDPWFGVSGELALGVAFMVDGHPEGTFIGLQSALAHDVAYAGLGAETYVSLGLTIGLHFDISFRVY